MSRSIRVLLAAATAAAAGAVLTAPVRADSGSDPSVTPTTPVTTTTAPTTTTAIPVATKAPKKTQVQAKIETVFPAAGQLTVNSVPVLRSPSPHAPLIKTMKQFRDDYRIQEILAVGTRIGTDGKPWYHISVPMRPNGTYGWIPARVVSLSPTQGQIVVHRSSRTIDIFWQGKHVYHAQVAIGAPGMETPVGKYYVAARFVPYQDPFLGVFAVETSAYSKLTEWPGGGVVGIHGTNMPQLLGQAVSHGCVRVANTTAIQLRKYAPLGTPILITD